MHPRVLLVEDDAPSARAAATLLQAWKYPAVVAGSLAEAKAALASADPAIILLDLGLPDGDGMELLVESQARPEPPAVIVLTGQRALDRAVEAMRQGAVDYLGKPVDGVALKLALETVRRRLDDARELRALRGELAQVGKFEGMIGGSTAMRKVYQMVERVGPSSLPVFVTGDSGTGKEMLARAVHRVSRRRGRPFVALNCGAIPSELVESELFGHERGAFTGATHRKLGVFERADGGTLLLDELGEMPLAAQVALLRVLEAGVVQRVGGTQEVKVDVRVVAATNRDPLKAVEAGSLRGDLFYRLHVFPVALPALRHRKGDIPLLAKHFMAQMTRDESAELPELLDSALAALEAYPWPGNVRELRNVMSRAWIMSMGQPIGPEHLGLEASLGAAGADLIHKESVAGVLVPPGTPLKAAERMIVTAELQRHQGRREATARALQVSTKTLYNKLKAWADG